MWTVTAADPGSQASVAVPEPCALARQGFGSVDQFLHGDTRVVKSRETSADGDASEIRYGSRPLLRPGHMQAGLSRRPRPGRTACGSARLRRWDARPPAQRHGSSPQFWTRIPCIPVFRRRWTFSKRPPRPDNFEGVVRQGVYAATSMSRSSIFFCPLSLTAQFWQRCQHAASVSHHGHTISMYVFPTLYLSIYDPEI